MDTYDFETGAVDAQGGSTAGGLIGDAVPVTAFSRDYALGNVTVSGTGGVAGGLIGSVGSTSPAILGVLGDESYAAGQVSDPSGISGGLFGIDYGVNTSYTIATTAFTNASSMFLYNSFVNGDGIGQGTQATMMGASTTALQKARTLKSKGWTVGSGAPGI
jgi:hypothetical protein